ncbi:MAG: IS5 family transposase [Chloroflexi bacterium]|nr:MAG: IS5 family transposase [Chloroflexota bacterium]TXH48266.1 MAG: IS5 family transposase [Burkholderiaceae bacterium]
MPGMDQMTFGRDPLPKKTRKEAFLDEVNQVVPWAALVALIQPHARGAHQALGGRPPFPIETMLRIHCLQLWWNLSDPAMEEELHERPLYRRFVGLHGAARMPDETTILRFRHLLEKHELAPQVLVTINAGLAQRGLMLKTGTVVDATNIAAPSSTKNKDGERDPEMHQTRKGKQWRVSRTQAADLWCCTEDGSRPPEAGLQEQASNHPVLLRSKGAVVSDRAKVIP